MNRNVTIALVLFVSSFIAINCNSTSNYSSQNQHLKVNDTIVYFNCKEEIRAEVGSTIEIRLQAAPVTGYQWLLSDSSAILQNLTGDILIYITEGNNTFQSFYLKAMKKGREVVNLNYKRVFEQRVEQQCRMKFEIY